MRSENVTRIFGGATLMASFLVACGGSPTGGGGGGDGTVPVCALGQALSTNEKGQIICKDLPPGVSLPKCDATLEALTTDGKNLSCVKKSSGGQDDPAIVDRINKQETKIVDLTKKIDAEEVKPRTAAIRTFVGVTANTYNGNLQTTGNSALQDAAKLCDAVKTGARMCTSQDLYYSAALGKIGPGKEVPKAWVYFPSWNNPVSGSSNPDLGYGDTCGSYTYPTADKKWTGTAVSTGNNEQTGKWSIKLHGGTEAPCNAKLPVACCL